MKRSFAARLSIFVILFSILLPHSTPVSAAGKKRPALKVQAINSKNPKYASIVVDYATGSILSEDSADAARHPASLTKMMTLLMVFDAMRAGRLRADQQITVSARAAAMSPSKLGLPTGASIRVADAMDSLATLSANDMAVALAEAVAGSEAVFAQKMTARAHAIGMTRTRYTNASGLPSEQQVTTARDQAKLARYMLSQYPSDSRIFAQSSFIYRGRTYRNHNRLMETYEGMDCCKTGFINASGFNLVASARRDGRRLIGVVFGGRTTVTRNVHMAALLDEGFGNKGNIAVASRLPAPVSVPAEPAPMRTASPAQAARSAILTPSNPDKSPVLAVEKLKPRIERITIQPSEKGPNPFTANARPQQQPGMQSLGTLRMAELSPAAPATPPVAGQGGWAIQIGAYQTRMAGDQAVSNAQAALPTHLRKPQTAVLPLRTADASWMFRARLIGYTQTEAAEACRYFKDCLAIPPQAY